MSTPKQVEKWEAFLAVFDDATRKEGYRHESGRALWHVLKANVTKLGAFPKTSGQRYEFHKMFRQADVTGCGHTDMVIWLLIHDSNLLMPELAKFAKQSKPTKDSK